MEPMGEADYQSARSRQGSLAEALSGGPAGPLSLFIGVAVALIAVSVAAARLRAAVLT